MKLLLRDLVYIPARIPTASDKTQSVFEHLSDEEQPPEGGSKSPGTKLIEGDHKPHGATTTVAKISSYYYC